MFRQSRLVLSGIELFSLLSSEGSGVGRPLPLPGVLSIIHIGVWLFYIALITVLATHLVYCVGHLEKISFVLMLKELLSCGASRPERPASSSNMKFMSTKYWI